MQRTKDDERRQFQQGAAAKHSLPQRNESWRATGDAESGGDTQGSPERKVPHHD